MRKGVPLLLFLMILAPGPVLARVGAEDAGIIGIIEDGRETVFLVNTKFDINVTRWMGVVDKGIPVIFYGNDTDQF